MATYDYSHRKGVATVRLCAADGTALKNQPVTLRQTGQAVLFGCAAFESVPLISGHAGGFRGAEGEQDAVRSQWRVDRMRELFNFVTLPFYWGRFEPEQGKPATVPLKMTAAWWQAQKVRVKGHPLCWHTATAPWLLNLGDGDILKAQLARIRREVSGFAGVIDDWDVVNEAVIMPLFDKYDNGITRLCKREGRLGLVKQAFAVAREANVNATLLINDFDMSQAYADLLAELLDAGVGIDAIGLQSHMHQGYWGAEKTAQVLARFARFGLPLHFTEINMVSGDLMPASVADLNDHKVDEWPTTPEGEERQAKDLAEFYQQLFAEPLVKAVTYWSFCDGGWLNAPAGLVTADCREKPSYAALRRLIKEAWITPPQPLVSDENGMVTARGYKGAYVAEFDGGTVDFLVE